jgi:5-methylcytosine-specific restriction endonuclease McrA
MEMRSGGWRRVRIVLTVAHLDHDPQNNDPANLMALCQYCHNRYDAEHRRQTRARTRLKRQPQLPFEEDRG